MCPLEVNTPCLQMLLTPSSCLMRKQAVLFSFKLRQGGCFTFKALSPYRDPL